ncbi:4-alpha-glucanotransferase [Cumulibacter manganitolerans]|uniref:4-alpha-glucanotransferase n=1 Tax=Cumulibacter manganitolerans TaxID=1884992 RepID=UPI001E40D457|nr:4-alpha-glucanotransferase [Cumulibacter manganitolerans]
MDEHLRALADLYGVATEYAGMGGQVSVAPSTIRSVLDALGVDSTSAGGAAAALARGRAAVLHRALPRCVVHRVGDHTDVPVRLPSGTSAGLRVVLGSGGTVPLFEVPPEEVPRVAGTDGFDEVTFRLPPQLPPGYHAVELSGAGAPQRAPLIVAPRFLDLPLSIGREQVWGYGVQLYSVQSAGSWAMGDLQDLADLATWSATQGCDYLLVNPLHAAEPTPPIGASPYSPSSRRFVHPIYLRPEAVPELATAPEAVRADVSAARSALLAAVGDRDTVDRDAVWTAKIAALQGIYDCGRSTLRQFAFDAYRARAGAELRDFAVWCALVEQHGHDWRQWPEALQQPSSAETAAFAAQHADRVDFHCWLQWLAGEQLVAAQAVARDAGMRIGILNDIAVGVGPTSSEVWSHPDLFARGVSVGAPPDDYNRLGQDWTQSPWRPDRLADSGFAAFREMVRETLAHSGGIRVDHIIGLFRLWWIPEGASPTAGTYVRYDHEALIAILMIEAQRAGAVIVGEDLGTVEGWVRDYLAERGVLGTSVAWFERDATGAPLPADRFREYSMASVTTHDLAPTAGYLRGAHLEVRDRLGLLGRPLADERAEHEADLARWRSMLSARGYLVPGAGDDATEDEILALHRHLRATPARLLNVALTDAVGDLRMQNQPGTRDEYPNWRVPLTAADGARVRLEDLLVSARAARLAATQVPDRTTGDRTG